MTPKKHTALSHEALEDIKYDVDALKKKLKHPETGGKELLLEIESLKDYIHELNGIFKKALEEIKEEETAKTLYSLNERVESVVAQNETIARGMVAISDKLEEFMRGGAPRPGMPARHSMGTPPVRGPARMAPPPLPGSPAASIPPPPVFTGTKKKKLGLFK